MTTTIKASTLKVIIKEEITLNGQRQDSENVLRISNIGQIYRRIVTCITGQTTTLLEFGDTTLGNDIDRQNCKYIRITNKSDDTNVELGVTGSASNYQVTLGPMESHMLGNGENLLTGEEDTGASFQTMEDIESLKVHNQFGSKDIDIEIFLASEKTST
jgi:hypothetical protein